MTASNILSAALDLDPFAPGPKEKQKPKEDLGDFSETMLKAIKETVVDTGAFVVSREDKGQDIPDEQLLGNLMSKLSCRVYMLIMFIRKRFGR